MMRKIIPWILLVALAAFLLRQALLDKTALVREEKKPASLKEGLELLRVRKDSQAHLIFENILAQDPDNLDALWAEAEVLRRARQYLKSEDLLNIVLGKDPRHLSSLVSLAYIRYKEDNLDEALQLVKRGLNVPNPDRENRALLFMMLGTINSGRSEKGWFFSKLRYGSQIHCNFLKAKELAPELPEVRLGLGTFYLLAPPLAGGNLDKALQELESAVNIAPDFATANARLAEAYKKKGLLDKYNFHIQRARVLDPDNEVLKE